LSTTADIGPNKQIKLLIIDDEDSIRLSLAAYFEDMDFEVQTAETAETALDLMNKHCFNLGIIDMRLPGKDGNHFIREAHGRQPRMRFIIHTGSKQYLLPPALKAIGMTEREILLKPVRDMAIFNNLIQIMLHEGDGS